MQVFSIMQLFWGGNEITIKPGGSFKLGGVVNKPIVFGKQVGRAQEMKESEVDVDAVLGTGMTVTDTFGASLEQELQVVCDTGQIFTWDDAFRSELIEGKAGADGSIKVKFSGGTPNETQAVAAT